MSSALRLGLSWPAATGASHLLRPHPASHNTRSAAPLVAHTRAFNWWGARKQELKSENQNKNNKKKSHYVWVPDEKKEKLEAKQKHIAWEPTKPKIKRTGLPRQGIPVDQTAIGAPHIPIPSPYARDPHIPDYPYGPRRVYKQSNYGLYGNTRIRFGNNVSEKHNVKTPRVWRPNVQRKRLWSFALGCWVQTRLTMRVLRTIDKCGGLDAYLLGDKPARIKELGPWGWKLRWRIMQCDVIKNKFHQQRIALGLIGKTKNYDDELASEMRSVSHDLAQGSLGSQAGPSMIAESTAEIDRMIASGADIPFGVEGDLGDEAPLGIEGPLEIEDMSLEPEADQDEAASSFGNEDFIHGAEEAKDDGNPSQNVSPPENGNVHNLSDVAKDEGFMKEVKP